MRAERRKGRDNLAVDMKADQLKRMRVVRIFVTYGLAPKERPGGFMGLSETLCKEAVVVVVVAVGNAKRCPQRSRYF
jgi:hypothetical protein